MEKQESKNRFPTFQQPRRLRGTYSEGKVMKKTVPLVVEAVGISTACWAAR
jgi:hypothetical protein